MGNRARLNSADNLAQTGCLSKARQKVDYGAEHALPSRLFSVVFEIAGGLRVQTRLREAAMFALNRVTFTQQPWQGGERAALPRERRARGSLWRVPFHTKADSAA